MTFDFGARSEKRKLIKVSEEAHCANNEMVLNLSKPSSSVCNPQESTQDIDVRQCSGSGLCMESLRSTLVFLRRRLDLDAEVIGLRYHSKDIL